MLVESSAVERRLSPGQITVNFFLFSRIQIKKAVIGIRLELSLTDKSVITYLSVLTLAITSASLRCMHRLTIKLAAHFPYFTMIKHGLTWERCTARPTYRD